MKPAVILHTGMSLDGRIDWTLAHEKALLAVVDSRGQVQNWAAIKRQPFWRGFIALCSRSTPCSHKDYLERERVPVILAGEEHVDLHEAMEQLAERFEVRSVRVDSGGILNGALLRAGLVDEVSVVLNPELVGGKSPRTMFTAPDLTSAAGVIRLKLEHLECLEGDYVWLRYSVS
jgi:2,5-diamino-6-(ribosylamino)-4(3H)-pyrimidinone 5'-phosphate reductase